MKSDRSFEGVHARSSALVSLRSDVFDTDLLWTDVATSLLSALLGGLSPWRAPGRASVDMSDGADVHIRRSRE